MAKPRAATVTIVLAGLVVLILAGWMVAFQVEFTQFVLVQTFGRTTRVLDGSRDAGLHFKWPFVQDIVRYDARTFVFEDTLNELSTNDKQNILLTTFCTWRITDPVKFQTSIGTIKAGEAGIRTKLRSAKSAVIGRHTMADLVNTDPQKMQIGTIIEEVREAIRGEARQDYGVDVVQVGVKSLGLPERVSSEVIEVMRNERQKEAARFESAGKAQALAITERAKAAGEQILAFARRKAGEIEAEGDRAAAQQYKEFEKNWQFAAYLRSLEAMRKELENGSVILLDGSELPPVKYFQQGPSLPTSVPVPPGARAAKPGPASTQPAGGR